MTHDKTPDNNGQTICLPLLVVVAQPWLFPHCGRLLFEHSRNKIRPVAVLGFRHGVNLADPTFQPTDGYLRYDGRTLRLLTVVDKFNRECLWIEADPFVAWHARGTV